MFFPISNWIDGQPPPGMFTYPFSIQLPDWLPASMSLTSQIQSAKISINYYIQAQFTPTHAHDFANRIEGLSLFRGSTNIYIFRPTVIFPIIDLKFSLDNKIGGFLGVGKSRSLTEIFLERNEFYIGEKINIKIKCDNSKCHKAIKDFKLKLNRVHLGRAINGQRTQGVEYIHVLKAGGCPARAKIEKKLTIDIPDDL